MKNRLLNKCELMNMSKEEVIEEYLSLTNRSKDNTYVVYDKYELKELILNGALNNDTLNNYDFKHIKDLSRLFTYSDITYFPNLDLSHCTDLTELFLGAKYLTNLPKTKINSNCYLSSIIVDTDSLPLVEQYLLLENELENDMKRLSLKEMSENTLLKMIQEHKNYFLMLDSDEIPF